MPSSIASTCTKIAAEAALLALLLSCASGGSVPIAGKSGNAGRAGEARDGSAAPEARAPTVPADVEVLADVNEIARPYRMVGFVEAERENQPGHPRIGVKDLLPALREKAGKLGADALIELETHPLQKEGRQGLKATAIAIVFTD